MSNKQPNSKDIKMLIEVNHIREELRKKRFNPNEIYTIIHLAKLFAHCDMQEYLKRQVRGMK